MGRRCAAKKVERGLERTLCSPDLCDSKNLTVYKRTIEKDKRYDLWAGTDYHLVYVMRAGKGGQVSFKGAAHPAEENEGGSSPYHVHKGTTANPGGAAHCYMTFKGRGKVEVADSSQEIEPGTLDFEIQAWRSFKTTILSEEPLGLKWYYEREKPGAPLGEWNQS